MKIYTRKGDSGYCSLLSGERVAKSSQRIRAIGTIDELSAYLSLVKVKFSKDSVYLSVAKDLEQIQYSLYAIMSHLACNKGRFKDKLPSLDNEDVEFLEKKIDELDSLLPKLTEFIILGSNELSARVNIARAVCRRAESELVALMLEEATDKIFVVFLNRLSDYLFTLARYSEQ